MSTEALSAGFVSLGCSKNLVDSQIMAGALTTAGIRMAENPETADVVIVNTCAFIEPARRESLEMIRRICRLKAAGRCRAVVVTGCLPQRYRENIRRALPDVDAFAGVDELERIPEIVRRVAAGAHGLVEVSRHPRGLFEPRGAGLIFSGGRYAYLKVAEGCNHVCAFCAIPAIRGRYRSRTIASLVREAENLLAAGTREIDLISQDVSAYGLDLRDGTDLPALLRALGGIGGRFWIRVLYSFPSRITDELLAAMGEVPQVCRYLDVPIQHSHPDILRAMCRAQTVRSVRTLAARARAALPDVVLRTTCLVGFPGESDKHFLHLEQFLRAAEFDHVGVFTFSPEEGTRAVDLPNRPPAAVAEERRARLMHAQRAVVDRKAAALVGREAEVLLDRCQGKGRAAVGVGRSMRHAPEVDGVVILPRLPADTRAGDFVRARYTAQSDYDLLAEAVAPPATGTRRRRRAAPRKT